MAGIFCFTCSCCGKLHEGSPSFGFKFPDPLLGQTTEIKENVKAGEDLCFYADEDGMHYFARVVLNIPIHGVSEPFTWGIWVSLSKDSYEHYVKTWNEPDTSNAYFGWVCSKLPYYQNTYSLATDVHQQAEGKRSYLCLHEIENELYNDFKNGISIEKAQKIAEIAMHG